MTDDAMPLPPHIEARLRCPRCRSAVRQASCVNDACAYAAGFPRVHGQPVLIDFEAAIFDRAGYEAGRGWSQGERLSRSLGARLERLLFGKDAITPECCRIFLDLAKAASARPDILVIGGGTVGAGAEGLYRDPGVNLVGSDVEATPHTSLVLDGHSLPFEGACFDGVWIQAVLEHVLAPEAVVAEIHRVLKPGGVVYAGTPFMQQVHLGAYDFTRFTMSGHRWLFRRFDEIAAGVMLGCGTATVWSIRYLLRGLGLPRQVSNLAGLCLFFLRFADRTRRTGLDADAASGCYFIGRRRDAAIPAKDMVGYYASQANRGSPLEQARARGLPG